MEKPVISGTEDAVAVAKNESSELARLITSRRTIHKFQQIPPPREVFLKSIDVARWAPNHKLTEPWRFYLIGKKTAQALAHLNAQIVEEKKGPDQARAILNQWLAVPSMIVATFKKSGDAFREKEDYAATCCAIQNMSLYLWSEGVGMKWSTTSATQHPDFHKLLAMDSALEEVVGLLWCGYPEDVPDKTRREVDSIIRELP